MFFKEEIYECLFSCKLFFDNQVGFFGIPGEIVLSRDPDIHCFLLVKAVGFSGDHASDDICLPSSDRWAEREDSQDLGAHPALPTVWR